CQHYYNTPYSF
nr:immunoglobulin light chain junction region [Macaca mulatta]MOV36946.1 immunoglobulin light chain junction region [Macaca mulatta]MOV36947.1 immunoglobulin light chain junction region [Macaca mulatta]MOV36959.1 immunoglobulin light chain junction region [Macaca mulatta]MOV36984.1 immunoglobulin light chain junction region [Macaca mulatta]